MICIISLLQPTSWNFPSFGSWSGLTAWLDAIEPYLKGSELLVALPSSSFDYGHCLYHLPGMKAQETAQRISEFSTCSSLSPVCDSNLSSLWWLGPITSTCIVHPFLLAGLLAGGTQSDHAVVIASSSVSSGGSVFPPWDSGRARRL